MYLILLIINIIIIIIIFDVDSIDMNLYYAFIHLIFFFFDFVNTKYSIPIQSNYFWTKYLLFIFADDGSRGNADVTNVLLL